MHPHSSSPWPRRWFIIAMFSAYSYMLHTLSYSSSLKAKWPVFGIPRSTDGGPLGGVAGKSETAAGNGKGVERYVLGPRYRVGFVSLEVPSADEENGEDTQRVLDALSQPSVDILVVRCVASHNPAGQTCNDAEKRRMEHWVDVHGKAIGQHTEGQEAPRLVLFPDPPAPSKDGGANHQSSPSSVVRYTHLQPVLHGTTNSVFLRSHDSVLTDPRQIVVTMGLVSDAPLGHLLDEKYTPHATSGHQAPHDHMEEDLHAVGEMVEGGSKREAGIVRQTQMFLGYQVPGKEFSASLKAAVENPETAFSPLIVVSAQTPDLQVDGLGVPADVASTAGPAQHHQFGKHVEMPRRTLRGGNYDDKKKDGGLSSDVLVVDLCPSTDSAAVVASD